MIRLPAKIFLGFAAAALLGLPVRADSIRTAAGGKIEGTILEDESDSAKVVIKTKFGKLGIPRGQIDEIERTGDGKSESFKEAARRFKETAADQYEFALWCVENKLRKEATELFRKVLALDPEHPGAREKLGYQKVDGKWLTLDELKASQGLVKDSHGKWVLPQQKEEAEQREATRRARSEFFTKVRGWQRMLHNDNPGRVQAATIQLRSLKDFAAVEPLLKYLGDKAAPALDRRLLVEVLTAMNNRESTNALQKLAIDDEHADTRADAIAALKPRKNPTLVKSTAGFLKSKENKRINNAADLLAEIGDRSVIPDLIDSLVTKHQHIRETTWEDVNRATQPQPFSPIRTIVNADGTISRVVQPLPANMQGGLNVGESPPPFQVINEVKQNDHVLEALVHLTDKDFGFDKSSWLDWVRAHSDEKAAKILGKG